MVNSLISFDDTHFACLTISLLFSSDSFAWCRIAAAWVFLSSLLFFAFVFFFFLPLIDRDFALHRLSGFLLSAFDFLQSCWCESRCGRVFIDRA